jgi:hypothetical protein
VNVPNGGSENQGTSVAAVPATKFPTMLRAAPMLAAAAKLRLYRLSRLMSKSELLYGGLGSRSSAIALAAEPPAAGGGGSLKLINNRRQRPVEGLRR